jgi:hypothetical protein
MTVTIVMHATIEELLEVVVHAEAISGEPKLTKNQSRREWLGVCRPSGSE